MEASRLRSSAERWRYAIIRIGTCVLVAAIVPFLVRVLTMPELSPPNQLEQTLAASVVAILLGAWLYRSVSTYPGIQANAYIFPAFSAAYGLVLAALLLGRLDYNRWLLVSGYGLSILVFYIFNQTERTRRQLRIGVVPFGDTNIARHASTIEWVSLSAPIFPMNDLDGVVADLRVDLPDDWDSLLAELAIAGTPVYHVKQLRESLTGQVELEHLSENSFGSLIPIDSYRLAKSAFDVMTAVVALALTAPLLLVVAIAIRIDTPGPAIFRQVRVGFRGARFTVFKFRTMIASTSQQGDRDAAITIKGDMRVTRLGRLLRRSRIDELPQLLNVARGEMSWIGPRPEAEVLSTWYESQIPFYRYRHIVKPGISGWAQVNQGHVADVDAVRNKLNYDFYYIKHHSPWLDALIVLRTLRTMTTGFGAH